MKMGRALHERALGEHGTREVAQAKGLDLAFVKIGFHTGAGGNTQGIGDYFRKLNDAGVPIFLKSVDDPGKLIELQGIM